MGEIMSNMEKKLNEIEGMQTFSLLNNLNTSWHDLHSIPLKIKSPESTHLNSLLYKGNLLFKAMSISEVQQKNQQQLLELNNSQAQSSIKIEEITPISTSNFQSEVTHAPVLNQSTNFTMVGTDLNTFSTNSISVSSSRAIKDLTAPTIQYEFKNNQFIVTSDEPALITITTVSGKLLASGYIISANETIILDVIYTEQDRQLTLTAQDPSGNQVQYSEIIKDKTSPNLIDHYVDHSGQIVLVFNEKLDESVSINPSQFQIKIDSDIAVIKSILVTEISVIIELENPIYYGQVINLNYQELSSNNDENVIQDLAGNDAADFEIVNIINNSEISPVIPPIIDKPFDVHLYDDVGNGINADGTSVIDEIFPNGITNDSYPTVAGQGVAGYTVIVYLDDFNSLSTVVDANGSWQIELPYLLDGQHHFSYLQENNTGLQSEKSEDFNFTVDTRIDSVDSSDPATHVILEVEGTDFLVTNNEIADQILTVKGQIQGLHSGDEVNQIWVEVTFENSSTPLTMLLTPNDIDANGVWTANIPLNGVVLENGNAKVSAVADIVDQAGNRAELAANDQAFSIDLVYAQPDAIEANFDTVQNQYTLEAVNSTQFLNILNISDQLNDQLEHGSMVSIGAENAGSRSSFASTDISIKSQVTGKIEVSFEDRSLLTVAKSYGVVLQKLDANGEWQYYMSAPLNENGVVASLGTQFALGAVDNSGIRTLSFNGLTEGEYRVATYVVPSELTQFLTDFELSHLGADGTLLGQQNQNFLLDLVSKALGADSPSTKQLVSIIDTLLTGLNTITLPISYILEKLVNLPLLKEVLGILDQVVDAIVAPIVTNTLDVLHNLEVGVSYSESYVETHPLVGNILENDATDLSTLTLSAFSYFDGNQYQTLSFGTESSIIVQGQFGTLELYQSGDYIYTPFDTSHQINGTEFFKYFVEQYGQVQEVEFKIKINGQDQYNITAVDDESLIQLVVDPTVTSQDLQSVTAGGLAYIGLGSVLDLNTIQIKNTLQFDIAHDTQRKIDFKAESGGVQVLTDFDLLIYKWNAEFKQYELFKKESNWFGVALLGGVSDELSYTLDSGQYIALLEPNRGINALYGYTLKTTQDLLLNYADPISVAGQAKGNVIDDINPSLGSKDYSPNVELLYLTALNGQTIVQDQLNSGLKVEGQYGTLEIFANGDYVYTAYSEKHFNYGDQDNFIYTVYDPVLNQSKNAELTITLDLVDLRPEIDTVNVQLSIDPTETYVSNLALDNHVTNAKKSTTGFGVVGVGLGSVLSADIIATKPGLTIKVDQGELVSMQFSATGSSVVGVGNVSDLVIYKKNPETGAYELYHSSDNFLIVPLAVLGIPLGGIYNTPEKVMFAQGEYVAYLTTNGVSVIGGNTLTADNMTIYDYNSVQGYSGHIEGDVTEQDHLVVTSVNDQALSSQALTIQGQYGELSITADGQYTYIVSDQQNPPYGKVDTFTYVVTDSNTGLSKVSVLNIKLSSINAEQDIMNEQGDALSTYTTLVNKINTNEVIFDSNSALSKKNTVQATSLDSFNKTLSFNIDSGSQSKGLKLSFNGLADVSSAKIDLNYSLVMVKNELGQTVNTVVSTNTISQNSSAQLNLELHDLASGQYELVLNMPGKAGSLRYYGYDFKVYNQYADQWTQDTTANDPTVKGNLLSNDSVNEALLAHTILKINGKTIVLDSSKTDTEINVTGQYGVLTVHADGKYSYSSNGQGAGKEIFVYELISPTGDTDKATLQIDVAKHVHGSTVADQVDSSSANDVFYLSSGADTVVYHLLNDLDARGGNGTDVWMDFDRDDQIDISALLTHATAANIEQFVSVKTVNGHTEISIDRDGESSGQNSHPSTQDQFESTHLITLNNTDISLEQLLKNNQIIY